MKTSINAIILLACSIAMITGCAGTRHYTQRGAVIGTALGAGYGASIGRDATSTLIGTALGGLTGAVIGNYHDQQQTYKPYYRKPMNYHHYSHSYGYYVPIQSKDRNYREGRWILVPGQYVGHHYVPQHPVRIRERSIGIVVERP